MPKQSVIRKNALTPTVLIAGGAGFIGSQIAEYLLNRETRVIVLDNLNTGSDLHIKHLMSNPKFGLFLTDINKGLPEELESVDYIIHLAGLEDYLYSTANLTLESLLTNSIGTKNLLDLALRSDAKFLLGSSIKVYQGLMSQLSLKNYFGDSKEEERGFTINEAKRFAEALVFEYYQKYKADVRIARLPEIYGPKMDLDSSGNLGRMLKNLLNRESIKVYGDGVEKEYYLHLNDAISGLFKSLFKEDTTGKIFSLTPKEPYSVLETAYLLKSIADREVEIEFLESPYGHSTARSPLNPDTFNSKIIDWRPKINLKEGVSQTLKYFNYSPNEHSFKPGILIEEKKKEKVTQASFSGLTTLNDVKVEEPVVEAPAKKSFSFSFPKFEKKSSPQPKSGFNKANAARVFGLAFIAFTFIFIAMPAFSVYTNTVSAMNKLERVPSLLAQLEGMQSRDFSNESFTDLNQAQTSLNKLKWLFLITGKNEEFDSLNRLYGSSIYFTQAVYNISKFSLPFSGMWETIRPDTQKFFDAQAYAESQLFLDKALEQAQLAQAELKNVSLQNLPLSAKDKADTYEAYVNQLNNLVNMTSSFSSEVPMLLGVDQPRKYLILFQNSNEIRATGGFIGSYAILEVNKGKIADLRIDDIYNPDGQIEIKNITVPAPKPITDALTEDRLYMRNANWNPDFPTASRQIADLYYQATNEKVDGVVAMDLFFAKDLLKITGPVFLTAFNEEISEANIYERAQYHSEFNYVSGSDQKKSFLTVLGRKLLETLFALPKDKMPELVDQVNGSLDQRHLMFYVFDSPVSENNKNWNGSVIQTDKDYLMVINSNLGGNKANYFVKNDMSYNVTSKTRDGLLRGELVLIYKNDSQDLSWPGGVYKNYIRVLTQDGSKLTGAQVTYPGKPAEDIFENIIINKQGKYNSFETDVSVDPQQEVKLVLYYDLPQSLTITKEQKTYGLYWQKQPGTNDDKASFTFVPPFGLENEFMSQTLSGGKSDAKYLGDLNQDKKFEILLK